MGNKLMHDRNGNKSTKRFLLLITGTVLNILGLFAGVGYLYFLFFKGIKHDLSGILAILGILSGFVATIAGLTLGEKQDK